VPKYGASFFIWYLKFLAFFPVSDTELTKVRQEMNGKKCETALDKPHSALFTFTDAGIDSTIACPKSLYAQFAHQRTLCADELVISL
jgi:hypothetical protein